MDQQLPDGIKVRARKIVFCLDDFCIERNVGSGRWFDRVRTIKEWDIPGFNTAIANFTTSMGPGRIICVQERRTIVWRETTVWYWEYYKT